MQHPLGWLQGQRTVISQPSPIAEIPAIRNADRSFIALPALVLLWFPFCSVVRGVVCHSGGSCKEISYVHPCNMEMKIPNSGVQVVHFCCAKLSCISRAGPARFKKRSSLSQEQAPRVDCSPVFRIPVPHTKLSHVGIEDDLETNSIFFPCQHQKRSCV